jgi:exopolyphosphatase/guanosine-5'-triphosphate,3'-diphosphate pyrophosphatase
MIGRGRMLCAAIDIGSNTTRVLVAEPEEGQLRKVMEQRAYTRIGKDVTRGGGEISGEKLAEVIDVVGTQVRLAQELGAEAIRIVATAAIRKAANGEEVAAEIERAVGVPVDVLNDHEEGRLAFIGATKALGHPVEGEVAVVDVGGGSSEVTVGTLAGGVSEVHSFAIGSGALTEDVIEGDPPGPGEIRKLRERIEEFFADVDLEHPDQAVAVGGSATSLRRLVGAVLEYETLERGVRVLTGEPAAEVAKKFELDPRRVEVLAAGILLLEQFSQMLGQPLQIGKGGLREGVILEMLSDEASSPAA